MARAPVRDPGEARCGRCIGNPLGNQHRLDVPRPHRPEANADAPGTDRGQQALLVVRTQDDRGSRRRFLERLEECRLGVLGHAMAGFHDGDAHPTLDGQVCEVANELAYAALVTAPDGDETAGAGR